MNEMTQVGPPMVQLGTPSECVCPHAISRGPCMDSRWGMSCLTALRAWADRLIEEYLRESGIDLAALQQSFALGDEE